MAWELFQSLENLLRNTCHIVLTYACLNYDIFYKLESFKEQIASFLSTMKPGLKCFDLFTGVMARNFILNTLPYKRNQIEFWMAKGHLSQFQNVCNLLFTKIFRPWSGKDLHNTGLWIWCLLSTPSHNQKSRTLMVQPQAGTFPAERDMEWKIGQYFSAHAIFTAMFSKAPYFPAIAPDLKSTICTKIQISMHAWGMITITERMENLWAFIVKHVSKPRWRVK